MSRCFRAIVFSLALIFSPSLFSQYQNVRISPQGGSPEEVSIAINPANPQQLAAGANISYYYYSTNAGVNWSHGNLSSDFGVWGDPCLVFDKNGLLYFVHLSNPSTPGYWIDRIVVQRSTDHGQSWNTGAQMGFNPPDHQQDKAWLATDMTNSPFKNRLYVTWTEFDSYGSSSTSDSSRILFSRSLDSGLTWSQPLTISDKSGDCIDSDSTDEGAVPTVGPEGEIYTSWSGPLGIMFDKSTDGGTTFGTDKFVTTQPGGWDFAIDGISRANGLPITACDISPSPYQGNIYINWSDQRNGETNTDVFFIKSTDKGETWGNVKRVNTDSTTRQQFFTWMTIDQTNGYIYIVFYDRRNTAGVATDVFIAKSSDGGETFTNFKVSQTSFTPNSGVFFGDYTNVAAYNKHIYPIWMRLDNSSLSVWTALINDSTATGVHLEERNPRAVSLKQNYPNPFNSTTEIQFSISKETNASLKVFDLLGNEIATLVNERLQPRNYTISFFANNFASGVYVYRLKTDDIMESKVMMLMK